MGLERLPALLVVTRDEKPETAGEDHIVHNFIALIVCWAAEVWPHLDHNNLIAFTHLNTLKALHPICSCKEFLMLRVFPARRGMKRGCTGSWQYGRISAFQWYFATLKLHLYWQCTLKFLKYIYIWKSSWGLIFMQSTVLCTKRENAEIFESEVGDASGCAPKRTTVEDSIDLPFFSGSSFHACCIFIMGR